MDKVLGPRLIGYEVSVPIAIGIVEDDMIFGITRLRQSFDKLKMTKADSINYLKVKFSA